MADGKTHDRSILITSPGTFLITLIVTQNVLSSVLIAVSYLFSGLYLSPDLDTNSKPLKRWGIFKSFWYPYRDRIKHRGISHTPVIGSLGRLAYLSIVPIAASGFYWGFDVVGWWFVKYQGEIFLVWLGCELSALNHLFLDR